MSIHADYIIRLSEKFPVVLYDGTCRFCNYWVQFILKRDTRQQFRFLALESEHGIMMKKRFGPNPGNEDSIMVLYLGKVYILADAVYVILRHIHHPARLLWYVFPGFIRNGIYTLVARYRHKIPVFQKDCILPNEKQTYQFLS